ncbi:branched-chain amino acid dehydrogenase [Flavonifractor sp. An52]|uniref:CoA transferase subunit A n=1 Tax=Flavonifractor sp. An52 TaxID=1965642 RepID=UPI000B384663|nr:3-oxoacid CoA-transferase subunit A [Flavonifractor sp. An52]OUN84383.1 branched-chain amino acid dehydrogenase [Flavonifractor sp. An52]
MELSKVRTMEQIIASFKDGQTIAIGGQTNNYMPERLIDCVLESGAKHLTVYSIDSSDPGMGISRIIEAGRVDKMITTHVGTNPRTNARIQDGSLKAELIPMGTFIERIRCGGMGLGGVLTKTGLGTVVEEGKQVIEVNGQKYLLETALHADVALTRCRKADPLGNLAYRGSSGHASHPVIATCADLSIVECDHFCDLGEIGPDEVKVPGMFVDMILV